MEDSDSTCVDGRLAAVKLAKARSMANFIRIRFRIVELSKDVDFTNMTELRKLRENFDTAICKKLRTV